MEANVVDRARVFPHFKPDKSGLSPARRRGVDRSRGVHCCVTGGGEHWRLYSCLVWWFSQQAAAGSPTQRQRIQETLRLCTMKPPFVFGKKNATYCSTSPSFSSQWGIDCTIFFVIIIIINIMFITATQRFLSAL